MKRKHVLGLVALLCCGFGVAAAEENVSANELVRVAVQNELKAAKESTHYMWRERSEKPKGSVTKEMVETPQGMIGRVIAIDDKPLTPEQRQQDDARVNRLLDPAKMADKKREQEADGERVTRMVRALPDAFTYEYAGEVEGKNGTRLAKLVFQPNPNFNPPSRETQVYEGTRGYLLIDKAAKRIARIDGTLFRDVTFGWGILGRLNSGGRFVIEQDEVIPGHWDISRLTLDMTGKALLVKTIVIKQTETVSHFREAPANLTTAQAIELLKKQDSVASENVENAGATKSQR